MKDLTPQQHTAIALTLAGRSQKSIATELGVDQRTIRAWLKLPAAQRMRLDFSRKFAENLGSQLDGLRLQALDLLGQVMSDPDEATANRLAAARLALSACECSKATQSARESEYAPFRLLSGSEHGVELSRQIRDQALEADTRYRTIEHVAIEAARNAANIEAQRLVEEG
jgi:hypothetical protein